MPKKGGWTAGPPGCAARGSQGGRDGLRIGHRSACARSTAAPNRGPTIVATELNAWARVRRLEAAGRVAEAGGQRIGGDLHHGHAAGEDEQGRRGRPDSWPEAAAGVNSAQPATITSRPAVTARR